MRVRQAVAVVGLGMLAVSSPPLAAQGGALGTFRWQLQPFCNVVTVTITQVGGVYRLEGTDDLCGGTRAGSVVGMAFPNPDGSIGVGFTTVVPGTGAGLHTDAAISLNTLGGAWRDSSGNVGSFVLTPGASTGGAARPGVPPTGGPISPSQIPDGAITSARLADGAVTVGKVANGAIGTAQIAGSAITSSRIADGTITTFDIANDAITSFKLAPNAVTRPLECVDMASPLPAIFSTAGEHTAGAPACPAGFTSVSTDCRMTGGTFMGSAHDACYVFGYSVVYVSHRCCRVP